MRRLIALGLTTSVVLAAGSSASAGRTLVEEKEYSSAQGFSLANQINAYWTNLIAEVPRSTAPSSALASPARSCAARRASGRGNLFARCGRRMTPRPLAGTRGEMARVSSAEPLVLPELSSAQRRPSCSPYAVCLRASHSGWSCGATPSNTPPSRGTESSIASNVAGAPGRPRA